MNFRKRAGTTAPEFQLTPMLDVMFLLLCFFITTAVFSQWEYEVDLALPTASTGEVPDRLPGEMVINVTRTGTVTVNQQEWTVDELRTRLQRLTGLYPDQTVILRADATASVEQLMQVIDACRSAGIKDFSIATKEKNAGE